MFCARMAIDEIFHIHPAARTGSPQPNLLSLGAQNLTAAGMKELQFALAAVRARCKAPFSDRGRSASRKRSGARQRRKFEKLAPRL
jgi:hypothetical protein